MSSSGATIHRRHIWSNADQTPDVSDGTFFETGTSTVTVTGFDKNSSAGGYIGQMVYVISRAAVTYSHDAGNLKCGTTDIVTADNDLTSWVFDGSNWILISFTDQSDNLS